MHSSPFLRCYIISASDPHMTASSALTLACTHASIRPLFYTQHGVFSYTGFHNHKLLGRETGDYFAKGNVDPKRQFEFCSRFQIQWTWTIPQDNGRLQREFVPQQGTIPENNEWMITRDACGYIYRCVNRTHYFLFLIYALLIRHRLFYQDFPCWYTR